MTGLFRRHPSVAPWDGPGRVVTVWGPTGSPGRSIIAAALAGILAARGRVVLVDADRSRGALGPLLGVTGGGTIVSAATFPAPSGQPCRPRDLHVHRAGFALIRGVPGPAQEVTLDPTDLTTLLARLRMHFDLILVDVGAALPPREFGDVHLAALRAADLILVVGALTPLGLSDMLLQIPVLAERLGLRGLDPLHRRASEIDGNGPLVSCVLNKGRGSLLRHGPVRVTAETGLPVAATIPLDARNVLAAEEARLPLTVARPRSPAAIVVVRLAARAQRALAQLPSDRRDPENLRRFSGDSTG